MAERRPAGYPKLKNYKPSRFMLPTSHYDKAKAEKFLNEKYGWTKYKNKHFFHGISSQDFFSSSLCV